MQVVLHYQRLQKLAMEIVSIVSIMRNDRIVSHTIHSRDVHCVMTCILLNESQESLVDLDQLEFFHPTLRGGFRGLESNFLQISVRLQHRYNCFSVGVATYQNRFPASVRESGSHREFKLDRIWSTPYPWNGDTIGLVQHIKLYFAAICTVQFNIYSLCARWNEVRRSLMPGFDLSAGKWMTSRQFWLVLWFCTTSR